MNRTNDLLVVVLAAPAQRFGGSRARALLVQLLADSKASDYGDLETWPSIAYLSRMLGCSRNTTRRAMRKLQMRGLVSALLDVGRSNLYRINEARIRGAADINCTLEDDIRCQYLAH